MFSKKQKKWARRRDAGSRSKFAFLIVFAYRFRALRPISLYIANRLEGGMLFSQTLRRLLETFHGVTVGAYTYGPCLRPGAMPPGTRVGAYCSLAPGIKVRRRNHPSGTLSQHPFFYASIAGLLEKDTIHKEADNPLTIGSDVWIGDNVLVMPRCASIGNGAMIGAGSVVTKDVAPYTIVAGNPARLLAQRYDDGIIALLEESRWWELPLSELLDDADGILLEPMTIDRLRSFCERLHRHGASG